MKKLILMGLLILSHIAMASPAKAPKEMSREKAAEVLKGAASEKPSNVKFVGQIAELAGKHGKIAAEQENLKRALLQGDADLLVLVYKKIAEKDEATLKLIGELSAGVKTKVEAQGLAKFADLPKGTVPENFSQALIDAIQKGSSLADAVKIASKAIGKTGEKEITLEKIEQCKV